MHTQFGRQSYASGAIAFIVALGVLLSPSAAPAVDAVDAEQPPALIAIIIDDLGNQLVAGRRTIALDAPIACAVMPHTAYSRLLAREAHGAGKEVMLHLPMQPMQAHRIAGPGEITLESGVQQLQHLLDSNFSAVPHAVGVNNHMGSLLTRHPGHMRWLMQALRERGDLFFIDSRTTSSSVAYAMALEGGIPAARRHVFLDPDKSPDAIEAQFDRLLRQAQRRGYAIGIGHPYPATLDLLEAKFAQLKDDARFEVVPVSTIVGLLESGDLQRETGPVIVSHLSAQSHGR
ncbi:MAG: divergent polysaccharide deacetylase family protein [Gammaproteobacteria bacterium]|nr:divergent polysaccharide deacetylase family protein [Gammaproteobacteria bacterium]NND55545.1 divergent polysaccharide deacetylase family protein [Gammaproteobacteria bacterium]